MVAAFERLQESRACFAGSRLSHDATAANGILLGLWHRCLVIGHQIAGIERFGMRQMSIEGQQQRRTFLYDSHAGMAASMNPALVSLGLPEPSLQIQIVPGQIRIVPAHKESGTEAGHRPGHVLGDGVPIACQGLLENLEPSAAFLRRSPGRIERGRYVSDGLNVRPEFLLRRLNRRQAAVDATGEAL